MALTLQAQIKWIDNLADFKKAVSDGTDTLVAHTATVDRLTRSLGGQGLFAAVNNYVAAIDKMGGVQNLTSAELERANTLVDKAVEKYQALGKEPPEAVLALQAATTRLNYSVEPLPANLQKAGEAGGAMSKFFGDLSGEIVSTAAGFISAQAVMGGLEKAFDSLVDFLGDSVKSYANAEAAAKKMTTALQQQGTATPETIQDFNDLATQFQKTTVYSDDLINEMEALLTQVGNVAPSEMKKALQASADLASGLGIDLQNATMLVAKAFAGGGDELGRLKAILGEAYRPGMDMAEVLGVIEEKFGGQASAEIDTYAGRIKQLKNEWDNVKEAVGGAIAKDPVVVAGLRDVTEAANGTASSTNVVSAAWKAFRATAPDLVKSLLELHDELNEGADTANAFADAARRLSSIPAPKMFQDVGDVKSQFKEWDKQHKQLAEDIDEGWKKDAAAADKYREAVDAAYKKWSGADAAEQMKILDAVFVKLADSGKITQQQLNGIIDEAVKLAEGGARLTPRLWDVVEAMGALNPKVTDGIENLKGLGETITNVAIPPDVQLQGIINGLTDKVKWGSQGIGDLGLKIEVTAQKTEKATDSIGELAKSLAQLAQISGGSFGDIVKDISSVVAAIDAAKKGIDAFKAGQQAMDKGDTLSGILQMGSGILGVASAAISAGKAIAGLISNLFGLGTAGRDAVEDFAKSFGGFDALHEKLLTLGSAGEQLWVKLTQGVGKNDPAAAKAVIDEITKAFADQGAQITANNDALSGLLKQLQDAGGSLPADWQPFIDALSKSGKLTSDNAALMQQLMGTTTVSTQQMEAVAKKYNLSLDQLGPTFQKQQLNESFQELIDDMDLLARGGTDIGAILTKTGSDGKLAFTDVGQKIQDMVVQSQKLGVDLPENMKPWVQSLIDQGLLLDASGNKITDISKLSFGESLQTSVQKLVDAIKALIDKMGEVPSALDKIPSNKTITVVFDGKKTGDWPTGVTDTGGDQGPAFHSGTTNVLPFPMVVAHRGLLPDEFPGILQTGEAVLNRRAVAALGTQAIGAFNRGHNMSNTAGVEARLDKLHGEIAAQRKESRANRRFMEVTVPQAIARAVRKAVA